MSISAGVAYVDVVPDMQKFGSSVTSSSKSAFSKLGGLAKLAIGGVVAKQIFDFGSDAVHAAEEAKAANDKSLKQIQSDADKVGISFDGLTKFSEKFGDSIGTDDEAITSLAAKITQSFDLKKLGLDSNKGLESLTKNILEFSSATGKSQTASTKLFQSIANDPKASLTTLLKLGVITKKQADHFGKMADHGKAAQVSQDLLAASAKKYAGTAEAAATPSEKLSAVWDNFKETIGTFLLPIMTKFFGLLANGIKWIQDLISGGKGATDKVNALTSSFQPLIDVVMKVFNLFKGDLLNVWHALVDVYNKNLKPALATLFQAFQKLLPILKVIVGAYIVLQIVVLKVALKALPIIIRVIGFVIQILAKLILAIVSVITWLVHIGITAAHAAGVVIGWFVKVYNYFKALPGKLASAGAQMWDWMISGAKAAINAVIGIINEGIGFINKFQIHVHVDPPGPGSINFDWNGPGIPTIPTLAKGGIVNRPTLAMIGEAGPEAVIPLGSGGMGLAVTVSFDETGNLFVKRAILQELDGHDAYNARIQRMRR